MNNLSKPLPRLLQGTLQQALKRFPVVVLTGARQTGKSTLIQRLLDPRREYHTLDDMDILERAQKEPAALLGSGKPMTLDEVQRSPELLLAVKREVDKNRQAGRFLLSGSANLALMSKVTESLAGRAVYLALHPFTLSEKKGQGGAGRWEELLNDPSKAAKKFKPAPPLKIGDLFMGGFPPVALETDRSASRAWLEGYIQTYLERDLRALSAVSDLADFRRLMRLAALRSGRVINQNELARDSGLKQPSVHRYLNLLETSYIIQRIPAYAVNRSSRVIKTPKLYYADTALAAVVAGIQTAEELEKADMTGHFWETLVVNDLMAWRETVDPKPEILHWRTTQNEKVDFVVERDGKVFPIEIKSADRAKLDDVKSIQKFFKEYGGSVPHGLVLYNGSKAEEIADRIWAVPFGSALGL
jgi:predicted AAA+ superfamily ATPase